MMREQARQTPACLCVFTEASRLGGKAAQDVEALFISVGYIYTPYLVASKLSLKSTASLCFSFVKAAASAVFNAVMAASQAGVVFCGLAGHVR